MFRVNDKVKVIATNKKGIVVSCDAIEEDVYEVEVKIKDKVERYLSFDLKRDGPLVLTYSDLKNIFRFSIDYFDLVFSGLDYEDYQMETMLNDFLVKKEYAPKLDDYIALLINLKVKNVTVDDFNRWRFVVDGLLCNCYIHSYKESDNLLNHWLFKYEGDVINYVLAHLYDEELAEEDFQEDLLIDFIDLDGLVGELQAFKENADKDILERNYTVTNKKSLITYVVDNDLIATLEYPYDELYKQFVVDLVEIDDITGLDALAYAVYGGNRFFECDWNKAQELFEKLYSRTGDPEYANSLGYIYYYGRSNNGIAQDDLAFKYFSIGAAAGNYESLYKLADMFMAGRAVVKNRFIAINIYNELFKENKEVIENGYFNCKFADIAYRVATTILDDGDDYKFVPAYYYLLMAKFAIDKRIEHSNNYGDDIVKKNIEEAIEKCQEVLQIPLSKSVVIPEPFLLREFLYDDNQVDVKFKHLKNNKVKISFKLVEKIGKNSLRKVLLPFFDFHGCILSDEFFCHAENIYKISDEDSFRITSYKMENEGEVYFYYFDQLVGYVACDGFRIKNFVKD